MCLQETVFNRFKRQEGKLIKIILIALFLMIGGLAQAQTPVPSAGDITSVLSKLTLNEGAMYGIKANSVSYTMTTNLISWKGASLVGGYSTAAKAVVGLDYDLMNLKGVDIPLLKYVDVHIGFLASWDNIGGRNVVDYGPVVTLAQLTF